ncbi:Long-chain-fatty-acid--CoA ligase FadD15 [Methylobacterium crusticola]|uniref:Long-chain-fatty-acid--CoA ligase FadD15 n=1 Tax=Methylobacterium crusticola TaxID=1697972 RepID=A0ABQ4QVH6_9HYPH|nr:AMP-binding protein [Methylobacterium crusticola]GJD49293.1 Long-chain-fatty-acid--CoA ligase FadD15 [Methylobacterium crusticola]
MTDFLARAAAADTFPKLLRLNAAEHPDAVALREKIFGLWRPTTWSQYHARARAFALGLRDLGVARGDVVALIGDNRPDWVAGEIAAHALGAPSLGIYRDALEDEVLYLLGFGEAKAVFAEDEEQVDKLLNLADRVPSLRHIVFCDPRGMRKYDDPRLIAADALAARGEALHAADPGLYDRLVDATDGEEVAILCTTSGTTARPKLAMLSSARVLRHCARYLAVDPKGPQDDYVSVLPLPWVMEQIYALGQALLSRMKVNFVEDADTLMHDFREIAPTFVLFAPRVWEAVAADVRARMMDASPLKRWLYERGMAAGLGALDGHRRSSLAEAVLFRALRDRLGFTRLTSAATGGAALGPDTFRFFRAMGVPLRQLYGQTEAMGAYTLHRGDRVDFDTVGVPFDESIDIRILDADRNGIGEVLARHANMFLGYYRAGPDTVSDVRDGWMHTGDAGYIDAKGELVVIDRIKDLAVNVRGERFSPQYIENKLKFSPYVAEAVILGAGREYLAALLCIRFAVVAKWAEKNRIAFTTYADLAAKPAVIALLRAEVERVNAGLTDVQRIAKFVLLYKELDADDGELTRTRKVRRGVINEKYADLIATLYAGSPSYRVDTVIRFQDGSTQRIRTTLPVIDLRPDVPSLAAAE